MSMEGEWLQRLATTLGVDPVDEAQITDILDAARDVAHKVERKLTPVSTFLLGAAVQRRIGHGATSSDALQDALTDFRSALPPT
jgi:hypothetical protein